MMKTAVLNGSPKGETSITMQYIKYVEKSFPEDDFTYIHAAQRCASFEKNSQMFENVMEQIEKSDLVIWAFPLYFLLVHSQYKRFIELIFERERSDVFKDKPAVSLSTSINFFDHTAHNYIRDVCTDFGMRYIDSFPAEMRYLMKEENRPHLLFFYERCRTRALVNVSADEQRSPGVTDNEKPAGSGWEIEKAEDRRSRRSPRVSIVTDADEGDSSLIEMIRQIEAFFPGTRQMNLKNIKMGPCLGCCECGFDNICAYEGKDDYIEAHRQKVMRADIIVFALSIRDRYFSSYWQRYLERSFYKTHQPSIAGKQVAFLVSGPLSENYNIREIINGYTETNGAHLVGIVTDEPNVGYRGENGLTVLAAELLYCFQNATSKPVSFLGTAGMRIFRDEVFSGLRVVFQEDHKYYRRHGVYDFPTRRVFRRIGIALLSLFLKLSPVRKQFISRMKEGMVQPYRKIIEQTTGTLHHYR